ncbi:MAG: asparagine synthase (glutamine-hydrolyzing) [Bacteroidota bacterium]
MCGITGILSPTPQDNITALKAMTSALTHRGPDDEGHWKKGRVALAQRRLSIIDLSSAGRQPMMSADGRHVLVYNGEIYNFQSIKQELSDYPFQSNTDSEVLLAAYQKWGVECLQKLNGMFAFAIYDQQKKETFIARDRLGIKPLYYTIQSDNILFASEIRSLLASGIVTTKINQDNLVDYLRYQTVHAPSTILDKIFMLPPACYMLVDQNNTIKLQTYWKETNTNTVAHVSQNWQQQVQQCLSKAVQKRLISDVPLGAFLSGGIDSSAIVALMAQHQSSVKTFNISFKEETFSEAPYARMVAEKFKTDHHEIVLSGDDFLSLIPDALNAMDHPSGDGPNTYIVSKATKEAGITVALSGLGGDELFGGYPIFRRAYKLQQLSILRKSPFFLRKNIGNIYHLLKPGMNGKKMQALLAQKQLDALYMHPVSRQVLMDDQINKLLHYDLAPNSINTKIHKLRRTKNFKALPFLSKISILELTTYMQNVLLRDTDQMSMAHALEVRVPFLDHELVELALNIPDQIKFPHSPKKLLVEAMGDLLPSEIVNRPKMGFVLPYEEWMKKELRSFCEDRIKLLADSLLFDGKTLLALWESFLKGDPSTSASRLWQLVVLGHWIEKNVTSPWSR